MNLEAEIRSALLSMSGVTTLLGTGSTARIRPYVLSQGDDAAADWIIVEVDGEPQDSGLGTGVGLWTQAQVNLKCRSSTMAGARSLASAVRSGIEGYTGTFGCVVQSAAGGWETADDGSGGGYYAINIDCLMSYAS